MTELPPDVEQRIADMSPDDFRLLVLRTRPPGEPEDPKAHAASAMRRHRGLSRKEPATQAQAADALRRYAAGGGD